MARSSRPWDEQARHRVEHEAGLEEEFQVACRQAVHRVVKPARRSATPRAGGVDEAEENVGGVGALPDVAHDAW